MQRFNRVCALLGWVMGVVLIVVGLITVVGELSFEVTIPQFIGVVCAFAGWGVVRCVALAWRRI